MYWFEAGSVFILISLSFNFTNARLNHDELRNGVHTDARTSNNPHYVNVLISDVFTNHRLVKYHQIQRNLLTYILHLRPCLVRWQRPIYSWQQRTLYTMKKKTKHFKASLNSDNNKLTEFFSSKLPVLFTSMKMSRDLRASLTVLYKSLIVSSTIQEDWSVWPTKIRNSV